MILYSKDVSFQNTFKNDCKALNFDLHMIGNVIWTEIGTVIGTRSGPVLGLELGLGMVLG